MVGLRYKHKYTSASATDREWPYSRSGELAAHESASYGTVAEANLKRKAAGLCAWLGDGPWRVALGSARGTSSGYSVVRIDKRQLQGDDSPASELRRAPVQLV
mmetsp:Transcript_109194/g.185344  ORF Transcript_109194/g.185344 Transcript_109194/m.185344 type:complete len:103 (+) Transcript_109194:456-764(+)